MMLKGMPPTPRRQDDICFIQPHIFWIDYFIIFTMLQEAVLMDSRTMCKRIAPDNCFVGLHRHVHHFADFTAERSELFAIYIGTQIEEALIMHFEDHGYFLERCVSCTFPNSVDGAFDLS